MQPQERAGVEKYVYREAFQIDIDLDIILIISLTLSSIFAFATLIKGME
jgi:hypothetical protein